MKFACLTYLLFLALAGGCSKSPPSHVAKTYPLGKLGTLTLTRPAAWRDELAQVKETGADKSMSFSAIQFMPTNSSNFAFLVELVPVGEGSASNLDLKTVLNSQGQRDLAGAVETNLDIRSLNGPQVSGNYFTITDRRATNALPAGEFKYLTQGFARLGPLVLTFRLVASDHTNDPEALELIRTARLAKP